MELLNSPQKKLDGNSSSSNLKEFIQLFLLSSVDGNSSQFNLNAYIKLLPKL